MQQLLRYVRDNSGRVILSGDTRQHGAVQASDALRAIEKYSGLKAAELNEIRRQDPARGRDARRTSTGLNNTGKPSRKPLRGTSSALLTVWTNKTPLSRVRWQTNKIGLAEHYIDLAVNRQSVVVVSQTWSEIHKVNDRVREALKSRRLLGAEDRTVTAFEPVDLTDAQKRDQRSYTNERVLVFQRPAAGFERGEMARLLTITQTGLVVESTDKVRTIPFRRTGHFTVCQVRQLPLTGGDRLQLKANSRTRQRERLVNGELVTVQKVMADGRIKLQDGRVLDADYRQFVRGFAITSYASQGKTIDYVLFSDATIKAATNQQQWYVTISRGRRGIRIFTSDKEQLRENIGRSGDRELALDLAVALRQGMNASVGIDKTQGIGQSSSV